ncbi:E3 ubiquitin-protein ligase CHFR [Dendroctonus ponderosae]|uniref:E3 ubiquitin-protein ligase CHFR n=1 Tax=Dendroctonus ponderosae TaxID=77166 RepID=U4U8H7_DENPD|nr:E3 ubiquitin-protein ligase CHFR [Dendroctonus ponderosae]ERL90229.1 hypothetical protein D910_07582 [Dendroctonus ponderosae]
MSDLINPVLFHQKDQVVIEVTKSPFTIGRAPYCDYQLLSVTVSRTHCKLEKTNTGWVLTDLGSNGTLVNGILYRRGTSGVLKHLDTILLGLEVWSLQFMLKQTPLISTLLPLNLTTINLHQSSTSNSLSSDSNSNTRKSEIVTDQRPATADVQSASSSDKNLGSNIASNISLKRRRTSESNLVNKSRPRSRPVLQPKMPSSEGVDYIVDLTNDLSQDECILIAESSDKSAGNGSADLATLSTTSETAQNPAQGKEHSQFESMKTELMCTICSELFIKPVTLACSHSFCSFCIKRWRAKSSTCPICRTFIKSVTRTLVLDNLVDKIMENDSPEDRKQRQEAIDAIQKAEKKPVARRRGVSRRSSDRNIGRPRRGNSRTEPPPPPPVSYEPSVLRCNRCNCLGHLTGRCPSLPIEPERSIFRISWNHNDSALRPQ